VKKAPTLGLGLFFCSHSQTNASNNQTGTLPERPRRFESQANSQSPSWGLPDGRGHATRQATEGFEKS